jgi:hypothetical protein
MTQPQSKAQLPKPMTPPAIAIQAPRDGDIVPPACAAVGTVSIGIQNVKVALQSSNPGIPSVDQVVDGSSGNWNTNFAVDPNDYPGDSTLTASIVGLAVATAITIRIRP